MIKLDIKKEFDLYIESSIDNYVQLKSNLIEDKIETIIKKIISCFDNNGKLIWDTILMKIPVFGKLIEQNILSKFSKTFGILVSAGVPVLDTIILVQKVVENRVFELGLVKAGNDIENGSNISSALKETQIFPPIMIQLISTGEETGEIDKLSLKASEFM